MQASANTWVIMRWKNKQRPLWLAANNKQSEKPVKNHYPSNCYRVPKVHIEQHTPKLHSQGRSCLLNDC